MKKYCLLLFLITLTIYACDNHKDPYRDTPGSGDTTTTHTDTISLSDTNIGAYALAVAIPATKTQADYETSESFYLRITAPKATQSSINHYLENTPEDKFYKKNATLPATPDFHTQLRIKERELMKKITNGAGQESRSYSSFASIPHKEYIIGNNYEFEVDTSIGSVSPVMAECVDSSAHAYFLIPSTQKDNLTPFLDQYKTAFENSYDNVTAQFGPEGDVDTNGKVIILFFNMDREPNVIGYFYGGDKYPISEVPESNEADMFYMNTQYVDEPLTVLGTLSHEFQHMTYFNNMYTKIFDNKTSIPENYDGDSWMNEGLSMLSSYICGYAGEGTNNDRWIKSFLRGGYDGLSLTYWNSGNYGYSAIFTHYLYDTLGNLDAIQNIYDSGYGGIKAVEFAAKEFTASDKDFNKIFDNFTFSLYNGTFTIPNISSGTGSLKPINQITDGNPINFNVPAYGISLTNISYPTPYVTFSHNGNFTVNAFEIK